MPVCSTSPVAVSAAEQDRSDELVEILVRHRPETIARARRMAVYLPFRRDTIGRRRTPTAADAVRAATRIGLAELERRHMETGT